MLRKGHCFTPLDGYDSRLKQGERDGAAHLGQHLTLLIIMTYNKQVGMVTIENSGPSTKTTKGKKHHGIKEADSTLQTRSPYSHFFST